MTLIRQSLNLQHLLLMIIVYHQIKIPIDFFCVGKNQITNILFKEKRF